MSDNIETVEYVKIPLQLFAEIQGWLCTRDDGYPMKIAAIKTLRKSLYNDPPLSLKQCKQIVDFIQYHPDELFINNKAVLIPNSVLYS